MADILLYELYGSKLSARELEVLSYWLVDLVSRRQLAELMTVSDHTVDQHLLHIYVKLGYEFHTEHRYYPRLALLREYWRERGKREALA